MRVHRDGTLHRAFSIFIFNSRREFLLQRRAQGKYHSAGLWSNTCCGHPRPHEPLAAAARRRLREEMGFSCDLREYFTFLYRARLDHSLIEHEFDHVLIGEFEGEPHPDPAEVSEVQWLTLDRLRSILASRPSSFSYWLRVALGLGEWDALLSGRDWKCPGTADTRLLETAC